MIRTFTDTVNEAELVWHRDTESRMVHVLEGEHWELQIDDQLPIQMNRGEDHFIQGMTYHRLVKGEGNLVVRIQIT
jgi:hypothetical protein